MYEPRDSKAQEIEEFIESLKEEIGKLKLHPEVIIAEERVRKDKTIGHIGENTNDDNGRRLIELYELKRCQYSK